MAKPVVLSLTAALAVASAYWFLTRGDDDDGEADDHLPREMILDIFTELKKQMPAKMAPLMQQLEAVKAQNPNVNEAELMKFVSQNFDKSLLGVQEHLFQEYGVEESDVDQSTHYYMDQQDEEVLAMVNDFRTLYTQFGGSVEVELPESLTEEKMLAAFDDYVEARDKANDTIITELQRSQGKMSEAQHRVLMSHAQTLMAAALKKHGITQLVWGSAVKKYMETSAKFKAKHDEDATEQNEKMQRMQMGQN